MNTNTEIRIVAEKKQKQDNILKSGPEPIKCIGAIPESVKNAVKAGIVDINRLREIKNSGTEVSLGLN